VPSGRVAPEAGRWLLSRELTRARERTGHTQIGVAKELEWSRSKFIRIETGKTGVSITDLRALLSCYEINDTDYIAKLEDLARAGKYQPFRQYQDIVSKQFCKYLGNEAAADRILQYQSRLIPGLLQTEEYARAALSAYDSDEHIMERTIKLYAERQAGLLRSDSGRSASFIIGEEAICRMLGGPFITAKQYRHLLLVAEEPSVQIRIVPFSSGAYAAMTSSFVILEFIDDSYGDMLFLESAQEITHIADDQEKIDSYKKAYDFLLDISVDVREILPDRLAALISGTGTLV
jgi:transcriptional regulator with XRE-family HTH domain